MGSSPSVKGQWHQCRPLARLERPVVGVATGERYSMTWVVAVVVAVVRVKNAWTSVMGRKTEVVVEGVGLHDTVDVRQAVGAVGRSGEAGVGGMLVLVLVSVSVSGRRQGGLD